MQGIGTLNETARNMFRGPSGVGAYQQFADGGEANRELEDLFNDKSQEEIPPMENLFGGGIRNFEEGRGRGYFDDVNFKIDSYEIDGKPSYAIEFDDGFSLFEPQIIEMMDENNSANEPIPGESTRKELFRYLFEKNPTSEEFFRYLKTTGLASGGEVSGPPPTRGPDPQGIGAFQQFADGGPVYMKNGGDSSLNSADFKSLLSAVIQTESGGNPDAVSEDDAIGLMQVLPTTAAQPGYEQYGAENVFDIAQELVGYSGERTVEDARKLLFNPEVNVAFGTKYLKAMIKTSEGDVYKALQKYNAGPGNYAQFVSDPVNNPLDQEAVRYPELVIGALGIDPEGMLPQTAAPMGPVGPQAAPFISSQDSDFEPMLGTGYRTPPPPGTPLAVEKLMEQSYEEGLASEGRRDTTDIFDKYLERREEFMQEEDLGDGLTRSLRPPLREEFLPRLRPRLRPVPVQPYGGSNPQGLMDGIESLRGRSLRKGFTPYAEDVRGEPV